MSLDHFFKRIDAKYRLPRPANALHLDAYQAGFRLLRDAGEGLIMLACGVITAFIIWVIANVLQATFETRIYFIFGMVIAVLISLSEALSLILPYYRISQRLTHGSARWADVPTLRSMGLAHLTNQPLPNGALRLGRLTRKYDLALPFERVICHTALFGPPNSGKSSSFIMTMARDWSRTGSAIFLDPKGELFKHTARHFRTVYRLDLAQPWLSDRWNFVPACKGDAELAHEVASIIVGFDANKVYNGDPFWPQAETALATGVLLHMPQIADFPTPAMLAEFLATRELKRLDAEMTQSPDEEARIQWGIFKKADREKTQGGVFVGLGTKLAPLRTPHAMAVMQSASAEERRRGVREIDLNHLREPGTAIYVIVPEGDATRYRIVLSILFGLVASVVRKTSGDPHAAPVLMALDEAGNIPIHHLSEQLGVGRGRRCGIVLGYQNIGQLYKQHGHDGANAILGSVGTMVFLPGLDSETAQYAARRIGRTTVLQHTSVDAPGSKFDNERDSETGRDLLDAAELRQMVEHSQAVAITGTAPPVIFGFPPFSKGGPVAHPLPREVAHAVSLKDAESAYIKRQAQETTRQQPHLRETDVGESDTNQLNVSSAPVSTAIDSAHALTDGYPAAMNIDARSIIGRVARNGFIETDWEASLNQPRQGE
ncbi:MAG TPA: type IV secretory system conjugative DNA transfer family protein [Blastocatellia bacterium]|nr:type IV secretory system conjugative DNA transfer family protein [Blastocatellia bacterium]